MEEERKLKMKKRKENKKLEEEISQYDFDKNIFINCFMKKYLVNEGIIKKILENRSKNH
jgi:hypothetical protein